MTSETRESAPRALVSTRSACALAAAAGLLITLACFYPGYMSQDSVSQLLQGRTLTFTEWHPPVMSLLWGLLDRVVPGPGGMLIFHNCLFWGGLSLFVYSLGLRALWAAATIIFVGLSPPIFAELSTIWKDVGMASSFVMACGLLLFAERERSKLAWCLALGALWYGLSVRHNAIVAVVPLVGWAAHVSRSLFLTASMRSKSSIALRSLLLLSVLALLAFGANRLLAKGDSPQPVQQILVHDLVGTSLIANRVLLPDYLGEALGLRQVSELKVLYTPNEVVPLFSCENPLGRCFPLIHYEPKKLSSLWAAWLAAIEHHPGAYLAHRTGVFKSEFGIARPTVCLPFWDGIVENSLGLTFHRTKLNRRVMGALSAVQDGPFFRGWLYLFLLGSLLILLWREVSKHRLAAISIGLSGLLYSVAYLFVATTCDFRLYWWTVLSVFLLLLLVLQGWVTRQFRLGQL